MSTDGRCATCQFWKEQYEGAGLGRCMAEPPKVGKVPIVFDDYSGWSVYTLPEFGCVMHEPKDETS